MNNFSFGILVGVIIFGLITYIFPRNLIGVNMELVKAGLAHYDSNTGNCVWNDKGE